MWVRSFPPSLPPLCLCAALRPVLLLRQRLKSSNRDREEQQRSKLRRSSWCQWVHCWWHTLAAKRRKLCVSNRRKVSAIVSFHMGGGEPCGLFDCRVSVPQCFSWQFIYSLVWQSVCYWSWLSLHGWASGSQSRTTTHRSAVTNLNKVHLQREALLFFTLSLTPKGGNYDPEVSLLVSFWERFSSRPRWLNGPILKHWLIVGKQHLHRLTEVALPL